ncbi:MAG: tRNA (guanosine(46)-N7)-methyltransferase TrmB [Betaproteobacteria bacterium]|jgi:tRNA (guanine-N7-)-methyltransferase|nr:tRNA (guanosine(46)-N7)-methyltransferase TrmB [Betaproteobacteria bacterium]
MWHPVRRSERTIRSYVLRQGRTTPAQARAIAELAPRFVIAFSREPLDLDKAFGRPAPKVIEIGFGMGEATAAIAQAHPEIDYLGVEVHTPGVGALLQRVAALGLANVRIIQHDATEVVEHMIGGRALDGVHVFFPDPWPKKRHHKRRLVQPAFVEMLARRMRPGAILHVATDWEDYAQQVLAVLSDEPLLENTAPDYAARPLVRPLTKFEGRGLKLGHRVWDVVFRRL